ncbi:hypothetical protein OK074_2286 [Actinobacteria bacterium OK074]|nr:hypothetical protein OK074_2286 [Actinobacteria bacterium OK074]
MSGLTDVLLVCAVVVLVVSRQVRAQRIGTDRRWWVLPAVLGFLALRESGLVDPRHRAESVVLLGVELVIGLATGAGWAFTTRVWAEPDGSVWSKGTRATLGIWVVGIALRVGVYGIGAALGVRQDTSAVLFALAVTLLVRSGILVLRAQSLDRSSGEAAAYGGGLPRFPRKERV